MTAANKDDKLVSLRAEFGMWGVGVYWTLVELTAEQIKEHTENADTSLIVSELLTFLGCKRNKLETFLKRSANIRLLFYELNGNVLKITIPKILDFADNYVKYDGLSLKTLQRQNKMSSKHRIEEEVEEKKNINNPPPNAPPLGYKTYGEFNNVSLLESEFDLYVGKVGSRVLALDAINRYSAWLVNNPASLSKKHYPVLLTWPLDEARKNSKTGENKEKIELEKSMKKAQGKQRETKEYLQRMRQGQSEEDFEKKRIEAQRKLNDE